MPSQIGQELFNVEIGDYIKTIALAIAEGQTALDQNSIEVAKALAEATVDLPGYPHPATIPNPNFDPSQPVGPNNLQTIANPQAAEAVDPLTFPLIALGIYPPFYNFIETKVLVKIAVSIAISNEISVAVKASAKVETKTKTKTKAFAASVNASYSRKYDYKVEGSSSVEVTIAPVTAPKAMQDYVEGLIQALQAHSVQPPPVPA